MNEMLPSAARAWVVRVLISLLVLGLIAAVAVLLQRDARRVEGPRPVAWGEAPCAHCRMLVSDRRYAAQLITRDGEAFDFDDPGCLFRHLSKAKPDPAAIYFHHSREERWLTAPAAAFARGEETPMGFGLRAVDPGTQGAIDYETAARELSAAPQQGGHR